MFIETYGHRPDPHGSGVSGRRGPALPVRSTGTRGGFERAGAASPDHAALAGPATFPGDSAERPHREPLT